jgi:hypothetical protein
MFMAAVNRTEGRVDGKIGIAVATLPDLRLIYGDAAATCPDRTGLKR